MPQKTKGEHINDAYSRLRISGLVVNPSASENELALTRLEDLVAEWEGRNICLKYNFEQEPNAATRSGVDSQFNNAIAANLAVSLCSDFGKTAPPELIAQARGSISNACARTAKVNFATRSRIAPRGSGNRLIYDDSYVVERPQAPISCKTVELEKDITRSYSESWYDFLDIDAAETIDSFTIAVSSGLTLVSSAIDADSEGIDYTVRGKKAGWQRVVIQIVTSASNPNKADERVINFNVTDQDENVVIE